MQADWLWGISGSWSACVAIRHWQSNLYGFSGWLSIVSTSGWGRMNPPFWGRWGTPPHPRPSGAGFVPVTPVGPNIPGVRPSAAFVESGLLLLDSWIADGSAWPKVVPDDSP